MAYRHIIALLIFASSLCIFVDQINLPVTILYMIDKSEDAAHNVTTDVCPRQWSAIAALQLPANSSGESADLQEKFDWDSKTQGIILGSFYWSFIVMQIPAGLLAQRFGAKLICSVALIGIGLNNLALPLLVDYIWVLLVLRAVSGALTAPVIASIFSIVTKWTPSTERSTTLALGQVGRTMGCVLASAFAGYMCKYHHWSYVFYISGAFIAAVGTIYWLLITNDPKDNYCVTGKELAYIVQNIPELKVTAKREPFPWKPVLTSSVVWSMHASRFALAVVVNIIILKFPGYLSNVMGMDIDEVGYFMSISNAVISLSNLVSAVIADFLLKTNCLPTKTSIRKLFNTVSFLGTTLSFCLIPVANCDRTLLLVVVNLLMSFMGLQSGGILPVVADLTNQHSPTLNGLSTTIAMSSGCVIPYILGVIFDAWPDSLKQDWWLVFYVVAAIQFTAAVLFIAFGSAELQNWERKGTADREMTVAEEKRLDPIVEETNRLVQSAT